MNIGPRFEVHPITPHIFHIFLALSLKPMHGYQILTQVQHDSRGLIKPNRGSIYRTLHNLAEWKWLDFDGKIYSLNSISRRMLEVEIEYHRHVLDVIDRRQPPKTTQLADNKIDLDAFLP